MLSIVRLDHWEAIFDFIFHITLKGMLTAVKTGEFAYFDKVDNISNLAQSKHYIVQWNLSITTT